MNTFFYNTQEYSRNNVDRRRSLSLASKDREISKKVPGIIERGVWPGKKDFYEQLKSKKIGHKQVNLKNIFALILEGCLLRQECKYTLELRQIRKQNEVGQRA
ncbi:hypothetical protein CWI39_0744p0010 [Hamiltosporidium magnivora]|uniref:Uncharacterized protein n=1 Tax=Hamiltosporidium magnivora TaxID=148818 RepID=A0A4Q9LAS1_9MICR|nr:hypothetical protein CWI39_0744p0010 [Hamiltosporidium magnivora]